MIWSKGVDRSLYGELRREDTTDLTACAANFINQFFERKVVFYIGILDGILHVQIEGKGSRVKLQKRSHLGIMECLLECMNILVKYNNSQFISFRDKIQQNLTLFGRTHVLNDLYHC